MPPNAPRNPLFLREEELDETLELMFRALVEINLPLQDRLTSAGLGETDYLLLFLVKRRPGVTMAELAGFTGLPKQNISRHVASLLAKSLVERGVDDKDRRRRPLRLTEPAEALLGELMSFQKRQLRRAFREVGPAAVDGFRRTLGELIPAERRRRRGVKGSGLNPVDPGDEGEGS